MYASTEQSKRARVESLATQIYSQHRPQLLAIARSNAANAADAEEALQEAFLSFLSHFDPEGPAPAIPWLVLTLKRACWAKRKRRPEHEVSLAATRDENCGYRSESIDTLPTETESNVEKLEGVLDARRRLAQLKPDQRTALLLLGLGYSYNEIAQLRGWTYTKVNRCLSEGRAALRVGSPV
jgi:RNA polymerase sigma factor (sigma-70 family)